MAPAEPGRAAGAGIRFLRALGRCLLALPWPLAALLPLAWAALIWRLSSHAVRKPAGDNPLLELLSNLVHAPLFGLLCLFAAGLGLRGGGDWPRFVPARVAGVLAAVGAYGVVDECHQSTIPGRDASALDVLTDLVGAGLVLWIAAYLGQRAATERGLLLRLGVGLALCVASAGLATLA